jgi:hypothetical protein
MVPIIFFILLIVTINVLKISKNYRLVKTYQKTSERKKVEKNKK